MSVVSNSLVYTRRRKRIRVVHFDLVDPRGSTNLNLDEYLGFYFKNDPDPITIGGDTNQPGIGNLKAFSKRRRVVWSTGKNGIGIERVEPFTIFALDVSPSNHDNVNVQFIGSCNSNLDPDVVNDCHYEEVLNGSYPKRVFLHGFVNMKSFIVRESPRKKDQDAKLLLDGAEDIGSISIVNLYIKLTNEKYFILPFQGHFPNYVF